jgi:multidrug resistance efflux pump
MMTRYLLPVLAVVAAVFAVIQMSKAQQKPPPAAPPVEPAKSPYASQLAGAGIVEPETENIAIGSHVPGIVDRVYVKVGESVRTGQPLFRLDERQLRAELAYRAANLASARASLEKLEQMPRAEEVPPVEAKVNEAKANLTDQLEQYDRMRRVAVASEDELSRRRLAVEVAKAQLDKARADLDLTNKGAWKFDKQVAEAAVRQAETQVGQTETELARLVARAPRMKWPAGPDSPPSLADADDTEFKVLQVNVRPGEYVGTVPGTALVVLGHVGRLHVRVDVDENEIARFRSGLSGVAKPRGAPDQEFPLTFVRIEPYVIPKKSLTGGNTERVDTRVLQVIYAVQTRGRPLFVGQQMDVFLNTEEKK